MERGLETHRVACGGQVERDITLANSHAHVSRTGAGGILERDERKVVVHGRWSVARLQGRHTEVND